MIEVISFIIALAGSSIAAVWDLKTTEIPDQIPHAMIVLALILAVTRSILEGSYIPMAMSLLAGGTFLALGFLLYFFGQWGGGDAKVLAAIAFLLPTTPKFFKKELLLPFPVSYFLNVLYVGAAYMIVYAFVIALTNKRVNAAFVKDVKASSNFILFSVPAIFFLFLTINWYAANMLMLEADSTYLLWNSLLPLSFFFCLWFLWKFVRAVENVGFKKRIPVPMLKVGDVLLESKQWEGITAAEVRRIKKSGKKYVWIKEGVRFGVAFPLALIFTLYFGDGILFLLRYLI
jgi:Flp pilus assembly protein protease CpaA